MQSNASGKTVLIVGAGPGGLSAAMILARRGFQVTVLEKASEPGGRNRPIRLGDYVFDTGPTFLMLPFVLEQIFELSGARLDDHLELQSLDPMYRLDFGNKVLHPTTDHDRMRAQIQAVFPGSEGGLDCFLACEGARLRAMYPCLQTTYDSLTDFLRPAFLKALPKLSLGRSLFSVLGDYFGPEELRIVFSFQSKYLGMSPWECPGFFAMLSYMEHAWGVYHVRGGLFRISAVMAKIAQDKGASIHYNTTVTRVCNEGRKITGVETEDGQRFTADHIVLNADFSWAAEHLLPKEHLKKWHPRKLETKKYSCSTLMFYLGLNRPIDLPHHTIFFADDYRRNVERVFALEGLGDDHSFYVQNACVTDQNLAPTGHSTLYILVPVPNRRSPIDWVIETPKLREFVLTKLARKLGLQDLQPFIVQEKVISPNQWEDDYHVYRAAEFSMAHTLGQMMYWRPHNVFEELEGLYLVGGGTHPGSGLPTIWESGRITADAICKRLQIPIEPSKPLPVPGLRPLGAQQQTT